MGSSYSQILCRDTARSSPPLEVSAVLPELTACLVTCWSACLPAQCRENPGRRNMDLSSPCVESFPSEAPAFPKNSFHIITDNHFDCYRLTVLVKGCQLPKPSQAGWKLRTQSRCQILRLYGYGKKVPCSSTRKNSAPCRHKP